MILVIDNYDSFTYNLVQYLGELGQEIEVRRNNEVSLEEIETSLYPDRILISPGPGTPDDAGISLKVIEHFGGRVPILGVCLGHQSIGQVFGGKVVRAPELVHGKSTEILHDGCSGRPGGIEPRRVTHWRTVQTTSASSLASTCKAARQCRSSRPIVRLLGHGFAPTSGPVELCSQICGGFGLVRCRAVQPDIRVGAGQRPATAPIEVECLLGQGFAK